MPYIVSGQNQLGKWKVKRETKAQAQTTAKAKRKISGNWKVTYYKVK